MSRRRIAVAGLAIAVLVLAACVFAYPFVRDHYNPWLSEKSWEQIQPGMTLLQVEALLGKGKSYSMAEVKAAVDEENAPRKEAIAQHQAIMRNHLPFAPEPVSDWDDAVDIPNQAVRQRVASWYRWQRGNTLLFVGVDLRSEVRLAWLRRAGGGPAWRFAVYPYGKGPVEPTGKSAEARLPQEKLVEHYLRKTANNPEGIEIAGWGPHDLKGELRTTPGFHLAGERSRKPVAKLRVRYWTQEPNGKPTPKDQLFYIQDGDVFGSSTNPYGDQWIDLLRGFERQIYRNR